MKYRVNMAKTIWLGVEVEADDEHDAIEKAFENEPRRMCAQCGGWREKWSISDDDEWLPLDEWHGEGYDPKEHGATVEELD